MKFILILLVSFSITTSCNLSGNSSVKMSFSDSVVVSRNARTAAGDPYIGDFSLFDAAYTALGGQVDFSGSVYLTPTSFVLPFTQAVLGNGTNEITLSVPVENYPESEWNEVTNVDFCQPSSYEIHGLFPGVYDSIYMRITSTQRELGWNGVPILETPILEVTVPGYTDADWPDKIEGIIGNEKVLRKYLGDNKFMFDLSEVIPMMEDGDLNQAKPIEHYIFCSDYSSAGVVLPGLEGYPALINTTDFSSIVNTGSQQTNMSMLLLPFEKIELSDNNITNLVFYVDTADLLTVYDRGTSQKGDDQLMMVKDYYNHFGVTTE